VFFLSKPYSQKGRRSSVQAASVTSPGTVVSPKQNILYGQTYSLLQKLVSESDSKFLAIHEEVLSLLDLCNNNK